jgi:hypothetical protein
VLLTSRNARKLKLLVRFELVVYSFATTNYTTTSTTTDYKELLEYTYTSDLRTY